MKLLAILIVVTIIAFFTLRTDLFTGREGGQNIIQEGRGAIDQARNAKDLIERSNRESIRY